MSDRVRIVRGDARALEFPDASFDPTVCLEAAGDICLNGQDKVQRIPAIRARHATFPVLSVLK